MGFSSKLLAALLALAACARPLHLEGDGAAQLASPPSDPIDASAPAMVDGALRVAVTEMVTREDAQTQPGLRVCPARGAILLCGEPALYVLRDGAMARDPALEAGLPHDPAGLLTSTVDVYGSWPEDAWLVSTRMEAPPPFYITVYRWIGARWTVVVPERVSTNLVETIVPWGKAGGVLVQDARFDATRMTGIGARAGRVLRDIAAVAPFDDGVVVVATTPPGSHEVRAVRLMSASAAPSSAVSVPEVYLRGMVQVRARSAVLYGSQSAGGGDGGRNEAYLARFDGKSLTPLTAPPTADVTSYVEDRSGGSWALSTGSDLVWHRDVSGTWQTIPLPMPYAPNDLTLTDDGAVWVRAFGPVVGQGAYRRVGPNAALFSTRPPAHALALGGTSP